MPQWWFSHIRRQALATDIMTRLLQHQQSECRGPCICPAESDFNDSGISKLFCDREVICNSEINQSILKSSARVQPWFLPMCYRTLSKMDCREQLTYLHSFLPFLPSTNLMRWQQSMAVDTPLNWIFYEGLCTPPPVRCTNGLSFQSWYEDDTKEWASIPQRTKMWFPSSRPICSEAVIEHYTKDRGLVAISLGPMSKCFDRSTGHCAGTIRLMWQAFYPKSLKFQPCPSTGTKTLWRKFKISGIGNTLWGSKTRALMILC